MASLSDTGSRYAWLSRAAGTLAASAALLMTGNVFGLAAAIQDGRGSGFFLNAVGNVLLDGFLIGAFALAWRGFDSDEGRARGLERAGMVAALGAAAGAIGAACALQESVSHSRSGVYVAFLGAVVVARLLSLFAALGVSSAYAGPVLGKPDSLRRLLRLMWAAGGLGASFVAVAGSQLLLMWYAIRAGSDGDLVVAFAMAAGGASVAVGASSLAARAFSDLARVVEASSVPDPRPSGVDLRLSAVGFCISFCVTAFALAFQSIVTTGLSWTEGALLMFAAAGYLGNALASGFAAAGFSLARR